MEWTAPLYSCTLIAMKTFIFADRTAAMNHFEIVAASPAEAIRQLVFKHGKQPYRIVNIIPFVR